jgi:hypothetical protein
MIPCTDETIGRLPSGEVDFRDNTIRDADGASEA